MANITVRNLDETLKQRLRERAARHGRSMEDEMREILRITLADAAARPRDLADAVRRRFAKFGGVELELPPRELMQEPPEFET